MAKESGGVSGLFFLGFLGFFVLLWFATGGPSREGSWGNPFLVSPTSPTAGEVYNFPRAPFSVTESERAASAKNKTNSADIAVFGTVSPYRGQVEIDQVRLGTVTDPKERDERRRRNEDTEHVVLSVTRAATAPIDITGWKLASGKYKEQTAIPQGIQTLILGETQAPERILVSSGNQIIVTSGKAPTGTSFRENMCTGYIAQYQDFTPSLSKRCPSPTSEFDKNYAGPSFDADLCRNHVASIKSCEYESYVPRQLPTACKPFVDQYLHHNGCVAAHKNDENFLGNTWRIYLGKSKTLYAEKYESIRLLDAEGRIVDVYAY